MAHPPGQQTFYGQGAAPMAPHQAQIYHQSMPNAYQQMGTMAHPMNPPQTFENRGYDPNYQASIPMANRS